MRSRKKKKKGLRSLLHSSNLKVRSIWNGKDRPCMPWAITDDSHKPLRKRKKLPRALRHHY